MKLLLSPTGFAGHQNSQPDSSWLKNICGK